MFSLIKSIIRMFKVTKATKTCIVINKAVDQAIKDELDLIEQ